MTTFINRLPETTQERIETLLNAHYTPLAMEGAITIEEAIELINEAMNGRLSDLEDTIDLNELKQYKWIDISDEEEFETGDLQQARQWLADFWIDNPYDEEDMEEDYNEEEHQAEILGADADKLDSMMQGIGYYMEVME